MDEPMGGNEDPPRHANPGTDPIPYRIGTSGYRPVAKFLGRMMVERQKMRHAAVSFFVFSTSGRLVLGRRY